MIMKCNQKTIFRRGSYLFRLLFSVLIAAGWIAILNAEAGAQTLNTGIQVRNSSGNLNIPSSVDPAGKDEGYSAVLYDNRNGLPTSEANAIAQTSEGFLWIGSYAGLIRYDGSTFERMDSTMGISNVRCLYVDSQDRLWIGTNDAGVFMMSNGNIRNWNKSDGLVSVSIRHIIEAEDGVFYIGSTTGVSMIGPDMKLTVLRDERIESQTIRDLRAGPDGDIYGLTQSGDIFVMKGGKVTTWLDHEECRVEGVLAMLPDPAHPGNVYLGTENARVYYGSLKNNLASMGIKDISPLSYTECFEYINGEIWICAGNGIGKLDAQGFQYLKNVPMNNSVGHVMTDYEGNLWFTSTRQGIMKIVPNQFSDLSERYDLADTIVNSTCIYRKQLFIGSDNGLTVVQNGEKVDSIPLTEAVTASGEKLEASDLLEFLDGVRIRSIIRDSKGRIWISTWRRYGLLRYDDGKLMAFTPEDGLFSDQTRMVGECEDGTILAANAGGVSVIKDDLVIESYGKEPDRNIENVLVVTEGFRKEILVGTDGNGIYVLDDGKTKHIGTEEGLRSEVILRIRRSRDQDVYWIITSNSIAFMTPDYKVTTIQQFPYSNNYDLYENSKGDAWILSSSGIYVVPVKELLANGPVDPVFYGINSGLPYIATANSYSELTSEGDLFISGATGVVKVNIEKSFEDISTLKVALPYVDADGKRFYPDDSGGFLLPGNVHRVTIYPYVFNYSMIDPQVSYRLEGFDLSDHTVSRSKLMPVDYTNLRIGSFQFVMTVRDTAGHTDQTVSFRIIKGKKVSSGTAGTIIMILASLLLMGGILIYTAPYRKRRRLEDRLLFKLMLANFALSVGELLSYVLEYTTFAFVKEIMVAGNTVYYIFLTGFPYLLFLYLEYSMVPDKSRIRKKKLLYGIPCFLVVAVMIINLKTGWVFSIGDGNTFIYEVPDKHTYLPVLPAWFYYVLSLIKVHKINKRLTVVGLLLIASKLLLGRWFPSISSTSFNYTLILMCIHLHVINRPINEVTP